MTRIEDYLEELKDENCGDSGTGCSWSGVSPVVDEEE